MIGFLGGVRIDQTKFAFVNYLADDLIRSLWSLFTLIPLLGIYGMFYGFGKQIEKQIKERLDAPKVSAIFIKVKMT